MQDAFLPVLYLILTIVIPNFNHLYQTIIPRIFILNYLLKRMKNLIAVFLLILSTTTFAQTYPFVIPATVTATLDVNTKSIVKANNNLLGYNYWRFKSNQDKDLARRFNPWSVRWSEGNFYNWVTDGYNDDSWDNTSYQSILDQQISGNLKQGYGDLLSMYKELKIRNGYGFDVLFNFSVGFTTASGNVNRLKKYTTDGINITDVEIGNEYFWDFFRNNTTVTPEQQVVLFKANADALHLEKPDLKISIPLGWRTSQVDYNRIVMGDKKYFDAIAVHKYVGADPDIPSESDIAYSSLLTARLALIKDVDFVRNQAPGKPVWLTEWNNDGAASGKWAAALGATDIYLYLFDNQNIYHRASWFSAAAAKNPFVLMDPIQIREPKYPLEKTISGAMYEIVRGFFENAEMFDGNVTTTKLTTSLGSVNAVNARLVIQGGKRKILAVNLTDKEVDFTLKLDGVNSTDSFTHEAMFNRTMDNSTTLGIDENPLVLVKKGSGQITLPSLSINVITLDGLAVNESPIVAITSPNFGSIYNLGEDIPLIATASDNKGIVKVTFKIDDVFFAESVLDPYQSVFKPTKVGKYKITAIAYDTDANQSEQVLYVDVIDRGPFTGTPSAVPGIIQIEDYDKGGQGIAYNDTTIGNDTSGYRPEKDVDLGIGGTGFVLTSLAAGEYMRYTINVAETGIYKMLVNYKTSSTTSKSFIAQISPMDLSSTTQLFSAPTGQSTGIVKLVDATGATVYGDYTSTDFTLQAGNWILSLIPGGAGPNFDYVTIVKSGALGLSDFQKESNLLKACPNPSSTGIFNLGGETSWEVYSLSGARVLKGNGDKIDLSTFTKGIYMLKTDKSTYKLIYQ